MSEERYEWDRPELDRRSRADDATSIAASLRPRNPAFESWPDDPADGDLRPTTHQLVRPYQTIVANRSSTSRAELLQSSLADRHDRRRLPRSRRPWRPIRWAEGPGPGDASRRTPRHYATLPRPARSRHPGLRIHR